MDWKDIRSELLRLSAPPRNVTWLAEQIPAHRATVYRWIKGEAEPQQTIVRRQVERVVTEHKKDP